MQSREMNIVEMLMHFLWFASGFVPGFLIAKDKGVVPGLIVGFIVFLCVLFAFARFRIVMHRKNKKEKAES